MEGTEVQETTQYAIVRSTMSYDNERSMIVTTK